MAIELFRRIFPEDVRYIPYLRACARQRSPDHPATLDHVWLVEVNGDFVGIRIFSYVHTRNIGHGAYVGLLKPHRGLGIGTWLVQQTLRQLEADAAAFGRPQPLGYCVEVEPVEPAQGETERRLAFHVQAGGVPLDMDYVEPPMIQGVSYIPPRQLIDVEPKPMQLVFYPTCPKQRLGLEERIQIVEALILDVYRLDRGDPLFQRAIDSVRRKGEL
jgi:GNAT superfamily N-acetyltransferase